MAFKRKFWKRGDKLNAKELNRIEEGIADGGSGALIVTFSIITENSDLHEYSIDTNTMSENMITIFNAIKNNQSVILIGQFNRERIVFRLTNYEIQNNEIQVVMFDSMRINTYNFKIMMDEERTEIMYLEWTDNFH